MEGIARLVCDGARRARSGPGPGRSRARRVSSALVGGIRASNRIDRLAAQPVNGGEGGVTREGV